jgi:hypothetical protein
VMAKFLSYKNLKSNISDLSLEEANLADSSPSVESPDPFTSRYVPLPASSRGQPLSFSRCECLDQTQTFGQKGLG